MNVSLPPFDSAPMRALLASESRLIAAELRRARGAFALSLEVPGLVEMALPLRSAVQLRVQPDGALVGSVRARVDALPFEDDSVHLIVVRHAIEAVREPAVLASEVLRVLAADGCLLVVGLQPWSLWRLWLWRQRHDSTAHWCPQPVARWRQWLAAQRTDCTAVRHFGPSVPSAHIASGDRAGLVAAGYLLVARKRRNPPMVARITQRQRLPVRGALAGPARRECA